MRHLLAQKELGFAQSFQAVMAMLAGVSHQKHKETYRPSEPLSPHALPTNTAVADRTAQAHEVTHEESL